MSKIQTLPEEVVHLMAAGEVIDSPAAVVRELSENALDAGATRITISLWLDQWRIRAADNGSGMGLDDLQRAATAHSTSKIRDSKDLWRISSLGFRGEALHSLAQLADLDICSRLNNADEGWRISYSAQGTPLQTEVTAIAPGTVVTASNLFGNWLARRQGLPSPAQQLRAIQLTVQHLALCHPHVTWQVEQGDRPWFALWASQTAKHTLTQILREIQPTDVQELNIGIGEQHSALNTQHSALPTPSTPSALIPSLYLLIGLPDRCHRYRPDWIKVAVNGRFVKAPELEQTISSAFRRTLPRDRYPVCFLHLHISPDQVDWNRHPAKTEIYLHHMDAWRERVTAAIAQAMDLNPRSLSDTAYSDKVGQLLKSAESQGAYYNSRSITSPSEPQTSSPKPQPSISLKAIAQVHNRYILAEHPTGVWLIEQHIAHERVLYEQLCDRWQLKHLTNPIILSHLTPSQVEQLQRIELEVEPFGEQLWAIRNAPAPLIEREDCSEALLELSLGGNLDFALVAVACRTAIRNGTPLSLQEMQTLLDQWQQTQNPRTCPHGRPICLSLEESSLSRYFRRHWVIGQSHGI